MTPQISYKLNKALDKKMASDFLGAKEGGLDYSDIIVGVHPELKGIDKKKKTEQQKMIDTHFNSFYKQHKGYLNKQIKEFQTDWDKVEKKYFKEVDKIFKKHSWPKGKYIGYLSIIDCNPRFLDNKTFQIFHFQPQGYRLATSHELLHFIFYDYCFKKYSKLFKKLNPNEGIFFDLAEIFNAIILSQPEFIKIHKIKKPGNYPTHKKYISVLKRMWNKEKDIDNWIVKSFEYLKNEQSKNKF